jgi:hypothetical protein
MKLVRILPSARIAFIWDEFFELLPVDVPEEELDLFEFAAGM